MAYIVSIHILLISQMVPLTCKGCGKFHLWVAEGENEAVRGTYSRVCHSMVPLFVCQFSKGRLQILLAFGAAASHHLESQFVTSSHRQCGDRFWKKTFWDFWTYQVSPLGWWSSAPQDEYSEKSRLPALSWEGFGKDYFSESEGCNVLGLSQRGRSLSTGCACDGSGRVTSGP